MTVHPVTFQDRVRGALGGTIGGIGRGLHRMHVHPDAITAVGLLVVVGAAVLIGRGEIQWGAIVLILGLPLDALDGAVARAGNRTGKFGGVLDSTFDRAADALTYGGLAYYLVGEGQRGSAGEGGPHRDAGDSSRAGRRESEAPGNRRRRPGHRPDIPWTSGKER